MDGAQRNLYAHLLSGYEWREPMNQIIFHCLLLVPRRAGEALREHLAACATRKGFPEFDWVEFFLAQPTTQEELEAFIRELRNSV